MSLRLSLNIAFGLCACVTAAHAQEAQVPPKSVGPMPPLTVPYTNKPLDPNTQGILNTLKHLKFAIEVKNVPASLMAYWLDPQGHIAPAVAVGAPLMKLPLENFKLPTGVESIEKGDDARKVLLVTGYMEGVRALQIVVATLDKPLSPSIVPAPAVELSASIFWVDVLAPTAKVWEQNARSSRVARPGELDALTKLAAQDRASLLPLVPENSFGKIAGWKLRFAPDLPSWNPYKLPQRAPQFRLLDSRGALFTDGKTGSTPPLLPLNLARGEAMLQITEEKGEQVTLLLSGSSSTHLVQMQLGETLLVSGSATQVGLKPPSPRFDAYVLCVTPRSSTTPPVPATP